MKSSLNQADCRTDRILRAIDFDTCSACETTMILRDASCANIHAARLTEPSDVLSGQAAC